MRLECPFDVMGTGAVDVVAPCGKLVKTMELGAVEARFLGEFARDRLMVGLPVGMLADRELFESFESSRARASSRYAWFSGQGLVLR